MADQSQARCELYFQLSSAIAQMDNDQLRLLFTEGESDPGWGRNHTIAVEGIQVFVKRIPVTNLEVANQFSTRNLYNLPVYYNYGVGSAGFGLFRELVTHIKTTNWVLAGAIENFPLLYHYRIIPATGKHGGVNLEEHKGYVTYWNNSEAVSQFILDRVNANHEALLFLEYIPFTLETWLLDNPDKLEMMIADMRTTIAFLRENGIIHFDAHWDNILTDGERPYLSDFGLTLDKQFALSQEEEAFFAQHRYYDDGEFLSGIGFQLGSLYRKLADDQKSRILQKCGLAEGSKFWELGPIFLNNIEAIAADRLMPLPKNYVEHIVKYRDIILLFHNFYREMRQNHKKDTAFDHGKLTRLLHETGFIP